MESTSMGREKNFVFRCEYSFGLVLAYRIHSSETTAALLEEIGGFHLEYRGVTDIKVGFSRQFSEIINLFLYIRVEGIIKLIG
jgi:hypothetical protein